MCRFIAFMVEIDLVIFAYISGHIERKHERLLLLVFFGFFRPEILLTHDFISWYLYLSGVVVIALVGFGSGGPWFEFWCVEIKFSI